MQIQRYTHNTISDIALDSLSEELGSGEGCLWVDISLPSTEGMWVMREVFQFHELSIEDVYNQEQRPKAEEFSDHLFIILNPIAYQNEEIHDRELDVFLGKNYLVTVHIGPEPIIAEAKARIEPGRMPFAISPSFLLYVVLDTVVDGYLPILEQMEGKIDDFATRLLDHPDRALQVNLFQMKRNLTNLWWIIWPQKDILSLLTHHNLVFMDEASQYYLRDVADHLNRITDTLQALRESVNGLTNLYVSAVSNQLNLAVNRLTVMAIIIGVLTVVSGFYGMNFERTWPPFEKEWGVVFVILVMIVISLAVYFLLGRHSDGMDKRSG